MKYIILRTKDNIKDKFFRCVERGDICPSNEELDVNDIDDNILIQRLSYNPEVCCKQKTKRGVCEFYSEKALKKLNSRKELAVMVWDKFVEDSELIAKEMGLID